ncbi:MAG: NAD-glutamate dehydrogenase [Alphaproteobacteria bacterium]|nr:NAD-glutamate dehydrogenase [Alphaproteobacteria bacterium]
MAHRAEHLKAETVAKVARMAHERLERPQADLAETFIRQYFANVAPEDVVGRDVETLYGSAMALLSLARRRKPGEVRVRVYTPLIEEHGWSSDHSIVELINDDMPFLVDSVTAELIRQDIAVHLVIHPILAARRDPAGHLVSIEPPGQGRGPLESMMHVEIDQRRDPRALDLLAERLQAVLADVRLAVADWRAMRERLREAIAELDHAPVPADEIAEYRDFLRWLHDDHFTFLGTRSVSFDAQGVIGFDRDGALGLLRDPEIRVFDAARHLSSMPPQVVEYLRRPVPVMIAKGDRVSSVHRPVPLDIMGIKRYDSEGRVAGMHVVTGLFTAAAYTDSPSAIPVLRRKIRHVVEKSGFLPSSHDGKALLNILETYPRDELFQIGEEQLLAIGLGILRLQERQRVALFVRRDDFERFVSCLVYVPRDRFDTKLRLAIQAILEDSMDGKVSDYFTQVGASPLARLHFVVRNRPGVVPLFDEAEIERRLVEATRSWADRLQDALIETHGEERGLALMRRYGQAFPSSYCETTSVRGAAFDVDRVEAVLGGVALGTNLYRPAEADDSEGRFKLYHAVRPVPLSDVLPVLEHLGFKVIAEVPHQVRLADERVVWIHDFTMRSADEGPLDIGRLREPFHDAFAHVWRGAAEDDGFNALVVRAGLAWRQVMVLRAYAKYLRQTSSTFSQSYMERTLAGHPKVAALLVALFEARFDPHGAGPDTAAQELDQALDAVVSADDDRILRGFRNLVRATLRTNYFQRAEDGGPKPHLALKLDSRALDELPLPRPWVEVFVYSPRMEGIHLRGGKVARGGIRWSDRREDFRTEILGLMKAQMVKNAVIIPVGAKGGFVVKRPPQGGREALLAEGIACYQTLIRGLLDITDNRAGDQVTPPPDLVRHDGDDPYLVVAADKGTATFSDIANALSLDYGFWLGDAFASGGSRGYDHKAMAITARGAWESVKRHFREMGQDIQAEDFTVAGVGDMSGDVFGNGMLRSSHIRLVAAFDHRHVFLDPEPDAAASFAERQRLFGLPRSSWADYDPALISAGGGVYPRDAKAIHPSPQARARFGLAATVTPAQLVRAILSAQVDLLWFGGIGTYVKASHESDIEVGDRANDALRVDARSLRCKVIGEGANLAVTQLGRIEYALKGGRLNTDAIDNSAGVDTSDHEVNIKILVDPAVAEGDLTPKRRNELLAGMTDEVAALVLRDNYLQTQAISVAQSQAPDLLDAHDRLIRLLEKNGRLDRGVEYLPDDEELARRAAEGEGLTRPEIAVLLAYGKIWLYDHILDSDLPDHPLLLDDLACYFPHPIRDHFRDRLPRHRLRREIIATRTTNSMINRVGGTFISSMMERTGMPPADIARAYLVVRDAFRLRELWDAIEALDTLAPAPAQTALLIESTRVIERGVTWVLRHAPKPLDIGALMAELGPGVAALRDSLPGLMPADLAASVEAHAGEFVAMGAPADLAARVAGLIVLASAPDVIRIGNRTALPIEAAAHLYFRVGARFSLGWLRSAAEGLGGDGNHWQRLAASAVIEELYGHQRELTLDVVNGHGSAPDYAADRAIEAWVERRRPAVERAEQLLAELKAAGRPDLAILTVANRQLRSLTEAG